MATSGTLSSSKTNQSGVNCWIEISWSATQNVSTNKSTISWTAKARLDSSTAWREIWGASYLTLAGTKHSIANGTKCYNNTQIASGSFTVSHNDAGAGSFAWNINVNFVTGGAYNSTGSGTVTLDAIPRASTVAVSSSSVLCDGSHSTTITVTRKSTSFTHTVQIKYGSTVKQTIVTKGTGSSYAFTPTFATYGSLGSSGGSVSCTVTCLTYSGSTLIGTTTCNLTIKIPTATTISLSASSVNCGSSITVTASRSSTSYKHTIQVKYGNTVKTTLVTKGTGTSYTFTPPLSTYAPLNTSGTSVACTVVCTTYNGDTAIGTTSKSVTVNIPNNAETKPTVTIAIEDATEDANQPPKSWGILVQNKSKVKVTLTPTYKQGASAATATPFSISGCGYTYAGASNNYTTGVLKTAGEGQSFQGTVKDTRGFTSAAATDTVDVVPYLAPKFLEFHCQRCDSEGNVDDDGTCMLVWGQSIYSLCEKNGTPMNTATLQIRHKEASSDTWESPIFSTAASNGTFAYLITSPTFDTEKAYNIQATITDAFNSTIYDDILSTSLYTLALKAGGMGVAIGKAPEENPPAEAEDDGMFETNFPGFFYKGIYGKKDPMDADWVDVLDKISILSNNSLLEQGDSGNWTYRKWANGWAEAWYFETFSGSITFTQQASGVYSTDTWKNKSISLPSGLFTHTYYANAVAVGNAYFNTDISSLGISNVGVRVWTNYSSTPTLSRLLIYVKGTWN